MRPAYAGPGSTRWKPTQDPGKTAPSSTSDANRSNATDVNSANSKGVYKQSRMKNLIIVLIYCQIIHLNCQLILHDIDKTTNEHIWQYDCLYYYVTREELAYQELSNLISDMIPYCFRPLTKTDELIKSVIHSNDPQFTFVELRDRNITAKDLLLWSCPIDLAEKYEVYLNTNDLILSNEIFYNCTKPWFGLFCQYSFEFTEQMLINDVVYNQFHRKNSYLGSSNSPIEFPCYVHIECNRGGSFLCLDWREICDGHVDCIDEGLDEMFCFDMELNECPENEYRCHNGLCIPYQFWENGIGHADCLDRSDEYNDVSYPKSCFQDPTFRCEEHSCRTNWYEFTCGDGQCAQKFDQCHNGRHLLLIETITKQKSVSERCLVAMICLTKLVKETHGYSCDFVVKNIQDYLRFCDTIFQFPSFPIHLDHIRFLYENISLKTNYSSLIIPDYVCYDQELCDCLVPNLIYQNLTCVFSSQLDLASSITGHVWIDIILTLSSHFRSCLTSKIRRINHINSSSLYQCRNSSKFISKHRITDENLDCCLGDDEDIDNEYSCTYNHRYRVKCSEENKCLSSLHTEDDCILTEKQISFKNICDGLNEITFTDLKNGQNYTDELDCYHWPCKTIYTTCDGYWTCPNGEDEENCFPSICSNGTYSCISPSNYSLICLSSERINDEINDCIGSIDEMEFCRRVYPSHLNPKRFRCQNSDICLSLSELCDNVPACPLADDEIFCQYGKSFLDVFRYLNDIEQKKINHFSLHTSPNYPRLETTNDTLLWTVEQHTIGQYHYSQKISPISPWSCNRGLTVRMKSYYKYRCMCPPSYYGDLCQYQNERVSLTLGIISADRYDVFMIVLMLINNDKFKEIHSYEMLEYIASQSCDFKHNIYLLFSSRPKNISKNYHIQIDVYEKHAMKYRASWYLPIPFLFLPVNRISTHVFIPSEELPSSSNCSIQCQNGQCTKYVNRNDLSFCRCLSGWTGYQCDIPIDCQDCSENSLCIGSMNNRSICICPLTKFGRRCVLTSSCPENACENNGQCIPSDMLSISNKRYSCICSDQYYGSRCQYRKAKLDIYLQNLEIPSYLLAYFFTVSNHSEPTLTIMIQKLTLFQRMVTFRISIPYHLVIVRSNHRYYLAVLHTIPNLDLVTEINPSQECFPIQYLFNSTVMSLPRFHRIKYYHILCQTKHSLHCFLDEYYLCFCTQERHANCFEFDSNDNNLQCSSKHTCLNGGQCLQDHPTCPSTVICVCTDCFYGNQCQFYSKGLGLTLDEILTYEIKSNVNLIDQSFVVKLCALITTIILLAGIFNSILSTIVFKNKTSQEVGCGIYLFTSSIVSLCIVILFALKFWFLIYSYRDFLGQKFIRFSNCMIIEPLLKLLLNVNNWLNACVAGERAFAVFKGVSFRKEASKQTAEWIIVCLIVINIILLIPQTFHLRLFYDQKEDRTWCVILYSELLNNYNSFSLFFHFFSPFIINLFSALFIIIGTAHQRVVSQNQHKFTNHFISKFKQHKHLLISSVILLILSL
ncbi:unnamed protein product, partial [Adineta ricciae]